jgi:hypothetical protein
MRILKTILASALVIAAAAAAKGPGVPKMSIFTAALSGTAEPTNTGSKATGTALIKIDTVKQEVSIDLSVKGITRAGLWDQLVAAPIGPIHFHKYGSHNHTGNDVTLVMPLPYGPAYRDTKQGFRVVVKAMPYAAGARLLNSDQSFDQFVSALTNGHVVLNIHTDAFQQGEISGSITPK